jgi:hypothetical protein
MRDRNTLSHHLDSENTICEGHDRLFDAGYAWTFCAENVAAGQTSPEQFINDILNSPHHRENMLNPKAVDIGIAFTTGGGYGTWWTQDFGAGAAEPAAPARAPVAAVLPSLRPTLIVEGDRRQIIQFNPGAALQKRVFADSFVPNSAEFTVNANGIQYAVQRAEHLGSGRVRVYYVRQGDWGNVAFVERGDSSLLGQALLGQGQQRQVLQFNPGAALQKRVFADGYVPNSAEFTLPGDGGYAAQRAEHLGTGRVRIYYVRADDWGNVQVIDR